MPRPATDMWPWGSQSWRKSALVVRKRMTGARLRRVLGTWNLLPVLVVLAIVAAGFASDRWRAGPPPEAAPLDLPIPAFGPANFEAALADADRHIELGREKLRRALRDWTSLEVLANGLMLRARLTGDYSDWAEARRLLDVGIAIAPKASGPVVANATLALSTHRLTVAERALKTIEGAAVSPGRGQMAGMAGLSGDISFYRGDMADAQRQYARGRDLAGGSAIDFRLAVLAAAQARFADADAAIWRSVSGDRRHTPQMLAQAALRLGAHALARGEWQRAELWFTRADELFPGYWLIAAHRVQARALRGDATAAEQMAAIAARSNSAEAMDATAMLFRQRGDGPNSRLWSGRAAALWKERLRLLPEAAYGHAVEHELAFGESATALDLALRNVAQRPYGEARLLLASALLMNNRPQDALDEIARAEVSGWRSAPLYALKAEAAALAGRPEAAKVARAAAVRINPQIFHPRTPLIWFSHG